MKIQAWMAATAVAVTCSVCIGILASDRVAAGGGDGEGKKAEAPKKPDEAAKSLVVQGDVTKNLISLEIFGTWKVDAAITESFGGRVPKTAAQQRMKFSEDDAAGKRIIAYMNKMIPLMEKGRDEEKAAMAVNLRKVWATGRYDFGDGKKDDGAFAVMAIEGTPHVLLYPDAQDAKAMDSESVYVQIAQDFGGAKDALIVGGDFLNQPWTAWIRTIEDKTGAADEAKPAPDKPKDAGKTGDKPAEKTAAKPAEPQGK